MSVDNSDYNLLDAAGLHSSAIVPNGCVDAADSSPGIRVAASLGDELWRRAQTRRAVGLSECGSDLDRTVLLLTLSLARLAAQRDARRPSADSTGIEQP